MAITDNFQLTSLNMFLKICLKCPNSLGLHEKNELKNFDTFVKSSKWFLNFFVSKIARMLIVEQTKSILDL